MKPSIACLAISALSAAASAQTGTYTWQVSADNGLTWSSLLASTPGSPIKVRLLASWTGISDPFAGFASCQFDATLTSSEGRVGTVSNIDRPFPFYLPQQQTLIATEFSGGLTLKIDADTDVAVAGAGTGWVNPAQFNFGILGPSYVTNNPVVLLTYDLAWEGNTTDIGMVLNPLTGRAMAIYTDSSGMMTRFSTQSVSIVTARIAIPGPATAGVLALATSIALRRRRPASRK